MVLNADEGVTIKVVALVADESAIVENSPIEIVSRAVTVEFCN
jgi:hypothetical protein